MGRDKVFWGASVSCRHASHNSGLRLNDNGIAHNIMLTEPLNWCFSTEIWAKLFNYMWLKVLVTKQTTFHLTPHKLIKIVVMPFMINDELRSLAFISSLYVAQVTSAIMNETARVAEIDKRVCWKRRIQSILFETSNKYVCILVYLKKLNVAPYEFVILKLHFLNHHQFFHQISVLFRKSFRGFSIHNNQFENCRE